MKIGKLQREWEALARADPMWAILSSASLKGGGWDSKEDEFFASGEREIDGVLALVEGLVPGLAKVNALDFGCGIGRLTRPLGRHFDRVVGVDVAPSMIERANSTLPPGIPCEFVLNDRADLGAFDSESFDFVYSRIVLQHIPSDLSRRYIAEFLRVLRPGGLALFQVPSKSLAPWYRKAVPGALKERWHDLKAIFSLTGKIRAHVVPRSEVERLVAGGSGTILAAYPDGSLPGFESFMYAAEKDRPSLR